MVKKVTTRSIIGDLALALRMNAGAAWVEPTTMYMESNQETEEYAWLGQSPVMREWIGKRMASGITENSQTIRNKTFEATLEIPTDWIRRDKTGQVNMRIKDLARRANSHWPKLLSVLILAAETSLCYDGQYFFDTDHSEGDSGSQSNDISVDISTLAVTNHGSTTEPSAAEMCQSILTGCQKIIGFKDDQGEPMNEDTNNFLVMVPTPFWMAAQAAVKAGTIDGGDTNLIQAVSMDGFNIKIVANARLTWTTKFAIFANDGNGAALIRQEEYKPKIDVQAEGSTPEFEERLHRYGVSTSRNVGYGFWQKACLVTLT